jgi:hypothetical protein
VPRYFFHVLHDGTQPDMDGHEFADIRAARMAAVRLSGEMIKEIDGKFWNAPTWQLEVTGQDRKLLFTLTFSAEEHALRERD